MTNEQKEKTKSASTSIAPTISLHLDTVLDIERGGKEVWKGQRGSHTVDGMGSEELPHDIEPE